MEYEYFLITVQALIIVTIFGVLFISRSRETAKIRRMVKEQTETLELESSMLHSIFEAAPDVMFFMNTNLEYTKCNKAFEQTFGLQAEEVLGKTTGEALNLPPETAAAFNKLELYVLHEQKSAVSEDYVPMKDGTMGVYETKMVPLLDKSGDIAGLIGLSRDITLRKSTEEAFESSLQAKTSFIANMSHEIRTPMNSIIGFSELALSDTNNPKVRLHLTRVIENSNWLLHIINDILDMSKIESDKIDLENTPFNLDELVLQCQTSIQNRATGKNIALSFVTDIPNDNRLFLGDPVRLRQILTNLAVNAVKFTNVGGVYVAIKVVESVGKMRTVHFEVRDTGIGMNSKQLKYIFEPFMQADVSITRKYGGTGLGLPIAKKFIELMGGTLDVHSIQGVGSNFSFSLTFETVEKKSQPKRAAEDLRYITSPYFNANVLVCEDNDMNQLVIEEHLNRIGIKPTIVSDGEKGLKSVQYRKNHNLPPFDLILMDVHMPVMDGLEATTKIIDLDVSTPILAMTANVMYDDIETYRKHGMVDCIGKPFTNQELWSCLLKYIEPTEKIDK
ncbi:MAG: ATP-binding protein [Defluviitaleaceae bacterium]|nr:ATP-binding protein [Defluviitaleaceae bacterium]